MKINYMGFDILLSESPAYSVGGTDEEPNFRVDGNGGIVYLASSQFGSSFSINPQDALKGAEKLIQDGIAATRCTC